jgi:hypothetical protein
VLIRPIDNREVLADLDRRTAGYGNGRRLAEELGINPTALRSTKSGSRPLTRKVAALLGWELRWVRIDDKEKP